MAATGSCFTNKYAEGYPGKRYYEGQQNTDQIEDLARERAKRVFHVDHANVQPYSGSVANFGAYNAVLEPGDTIMGLSLPHGGHLTHGWKVSVTSKYFKSVQYSLREDTGLLDYNQIEDLAKEHKPKVIVSGATAYPRQIDFKAFGDIAKKVGAFHVSDIAHIAGLVVAGAHPSPVPYADIVTTTTHKTLRGPRGGMIMCTEALAKQVDRSVFPGMQGGPHIHSISGLAVALGEAGTAEFAAYGKQIVKNAARLAAKLMAYGFDLVTGGTDNHLILIDLRNKNIPGKILAKALDRAHIVANYNSVPGDTAPPFNPSGLRLGTPAVTTRGMKEEQMDSIASFINTIAVHVDDETVIEKTGKDVVALCASFPLPDLFV
jgi:glycine hydroxymethyltransferase